MQLTYSNISSLLVILNEVYSSVHIHILHTGAPKGICIHLYTVFLSSLLLHRFISLRLLYIEGDCCWRSHPCQFYCFIIWLVADGRRWCNVCILFWEILHFMKNQHFPVLSFLAFWASSSVRRSISYWS